MWLFTFALAIWIFLPFRLIGIPQYATPIYMYDFISTVVRSSSSFNTGTLQVSLCSPTAPPPRDLPFPIGQTHNADWIPHDTCSSILRPDRFHFSPATASAPSRILGFVTELFGVGVLPLMACGRGLALKECGRLESSVSFLVADASRARSRFLATARVIRGEVDGE